MTADGVGAVCGAMTAKAETMDCGPQVPWVGKVSVDRKGHWEDAGKRPGRDAWLRIRLE